MEVINVLGKPCPIPVIEAKKALRKAAPGETVQVLVDNDVSRQNLEKMAAGLGCSSAFEVREDGAILVSISAAANPAASPAAGATASPAASGGQGLTIAIGKNTLGSGDDKLGALLIKSFIYSLTELESPPENLLFFNSGVRLTTRGSGLTEDLKTLEDRGTLISSCGTCLDYYQLKDQLAVGGVTNMYAIVSALAGAAKVFSV
jgi:selenium metabolism protein YedF